MAPAKTDEQRILLKPREAAVRLAISERQLWAHTSPRGPIPAMRIGTCLRYSPDALQQFVESQQEKASEHFRRQKESEVAHAG